MNLSVLTGFFNPYQMIGTVGPILMARAIRTVANSMIEIRSNLKQVVYGSDDRTSELRDLGFAERRHLGSLQMSTDTALLVSFD